MMLGRIHSAALSPQSDRVIGQLFLPGEDTTTPHSRAAEIVARVLAVPEPDVARLAFELLESFAARHPNLRELLLAHADAVSSRLAHRLEISESRRLLLGASFTAEFALEGAALCNPSAVIHPDQTGTLPGQVRVAVALRSIGEGHLSSISFAEALVGPGETWEFSERVMPPRRPSLQDGVWTLAHFRAVATHEGILNETSHAVLRGLPEQFSVSDVAAAASALPSELATRAGSGHQIEVLLRVAASAYNATFSRGSALSQRVLTPVATEEFHGMEDARFVRFVDADGAVEYRATYTAYDGREIAPRLIVTPDLRRFRIQRLAGDAADNKGLALFPRHVGGRHLALCRTEGENIALAASADGLTWHHAGLIAAPRHPWEIIQTGNCGPPLETEHGWVVLTHGVGPMRTYVLGALLLDLDDPTIVRGRVSAPIATPETGSRDGYVPNVVYSCGGLIHEGVLWVPLGIADTHVGVWSVSLADLLSAMDVSTPQP